MREAIFKLEIECLFLRHHIGDPQQWDVLKAIFRNPVDITKHYLLKEEISSSDELVKHLANLGVGNDTFIADVRSLFEVADDLELPDSLREQLVRKEKLAIFAGAGVSKLVGVPLWEELAREAIKYLHEIEKLNFAEAERIIAEPTTPKQKMSIFHDACPKNEPASKEFYKRHLELKRVPAGGKNPYDLLAKLEIPKLTTNLDHEFWNALQRKPRPTGGDTHLATESGPNPTQVVSGFKETMPIDTT